MGLGAVLEQRRDVGGVGRDGCENDKFIKHAAKLFRFLADALVLEDVFGYSGEETRGEEKNMDEKCEDGRTLFCVHLAKNE